VPALTAILKHFMEKVAAEKAKPGGGDPAIISAALVEARITAAALAPYQSPRLSAGNRLAHPATRSRWASCASVSPDKRNPMPLS
jgi:hypothetical protein